MDDNGDKETGIDYGQYTGLGRRVRQPLFEKDIMTPSPDVMEAISQSYFPDQEKLMIACQYITMLEAIGLVEEIKQALYAINGNRAILARSLRYAVQAHGGLYWPDESTKDEKKFLAKQFRNKGMDEEKDTKE